MSQVKTNTRHSHDNYSIDETMGKLMKKAEIARITQTLKTKLASASLETKKSSPFKTPEKNARRRAKHIYTPTPSSAANSVNFSSMPNFHLPSTDPFIPSSNITTTADIPAIDSQAQSSTPGATAQSATTPLLSISEPPVSGASGATTSTATTPSGCASAASSAAAAAASKDASKVAASKVAASKAANNGADPTIMSPDPVLVCPSTPPTTHRELPKTPETNLRNLGDGAGADLLLHFAKSPGRASAPNTPDFNMNEYLNLHTPSPANRVNITPRTPGRLYWQGLNPRLFDQS